VWQIECDAPSKIDPSKHVRHGRIQPVSSPSATPNRRLRLPGNCYPAYSYVNTRTLLPTSRSLRSMLRQLLFPDQSGFQFSRAPVHHWGHFAGRQRLRTAWFAAEGRRCGHGCLSAATASVALVNPLTQDLKTKTFPCFDHDTIVDVFAPPRFRSRGPTTPPRSNPWTAPNAIQESATRWKNCEGPYWTKGASNDSSTPTADVLRTSAIAI